MTAGAGILHIETPPESLVMSGACSTGSSCGSTCPPPRSGWPRPTRASRAPTSRSRRAPTVAPSCACSPGPSPGTPARGAASRRSRSCTRPSPPGARLELPWRRPTSTPWSTPCPGAAAWAPTGSRSTPASSRSSDPVTTSRSRRRPASRVATPALDVLLLGGVPLREPVFAYGPFVMNTKAEVIQAIEDYQRGRLGVIPEGAIMPHHG